MMSRAIRMALALTGATLCTVALIRAEAMHTPIWIQVLALVLLAFNFLQFALALNSKD